jgi:hypothetical protein
MMPLDRSWSVVAHPDLHQGRMEIYRPYSVIAKGRVKAYHWPKANQGLGGITMKRMGGITMKRTFGLLCVLAVTGYVMMMRASTPVGVTPTLIGRGTFERFKVKNRWPSRL